MTSSNEATKRKGGLLTRPQKYRTALIIFDPGPYAPVPEQLPIRGIPYAGSRWQSSQFGIQAQGTVGSHRSDVSVGIAPNYSSFYSPEYNLLHLSPSTTWQVEGRSAAMPSWNNPSVALAQSSRLTNTSLVLADAASANIQATTTRVSASQLPFDWATSEAMADRGGTHLGQTTFKDMMVGPGPNELMGYYESQRAYEGPMKREDGRSSSTLFGRSQVWTLEPSSRAAETQASTRVVKSSNRYMCTICFKGHTRLSRAMACENGHLGYQPFVCDGTCGDPVW
ncbi:hypothetical protein FRC20_010226 [Serendipita sp. 405]|nr:hypothetical protein FRC20_010226 [Serendipita sp. 405]